MKRAFARARMESENQPSVTKMAISTKVRLEYLFDVLGGRRSFAAGVFYAHLRFWFRNGGESCFSLVRSAIGRGQNQFRLEFRHGSCCCGRKRRPRFVLSSLAEQLRIWTGKRRKQPGVSI